VLISVIVSEGYLLDEDKQEWVEQQLVERFKEGTKVGGADSPL